MLASFITFDTWQYRLIHFRAVLTLIIKSRATSWTGLRSCNTHSTINRRQFGQVRAFACSFVDGPHDKIRGFDVD